VCSDGFGGYDNAWLRRQITYTFVGYLGEKYRLKIKNNQAQKQH
jgi:hypothetical protein